MKSNPQKHLCNFLFLAFVAFGLCSPPSLGMSCDSFIEHPQFARLVQDGESAVADPANIKTHPIELSLQISAEANQLIPQVGFGHPLILNALRTANELNSLAGEIKQPNISSMEMGVVSASKAGKWATEGGTFTGGFIEYNGNLFYVYFGSNKKNLSRIIFQGKSLDIVQSNKSIDRLLKYLDQTLDPTSNEIVAVDFGDRLGDLTLDEIKKIQEIVDELNEPIFVVGSAAKGKRRNIGSGFPMGKGDERRSDIDYLSPLSLRNLDTELERLDLFNQLPEIDNWSGNYNHGVLEEDLVLSSAPTIFFTPFSNPISIKKKSH